MTRFRQVRSKSVLSIGLAGLAAASAACAITLVGQRLADERAAAAVASIGRDATAPSTMRASSTVPSSAIFTAAATDSTGKSNEPRRRSFQ